MSFRSDIGQFAIAPRWVLAAPISQGAKNLYWLLGCYANQGGEAFPSQERLAEDLGATDRTVRRWMTELKKIGAIETKQRKQLPMMWVVHTTEPGFDRAVDNSDQDRTSVSGLEVQDRTQLVSARRELNLYPSEAKASSGGADAPRVVNNLMAFNAERRSAAGRIGYTRSEHAILAKNIQAALDQGVDMRHIEGGIIVLIEKGLGPTALNRAIDEAQARKIRARPKESKQEWAQYERDALPREEQVQHLRRAAASLFGDASTAGSAAGDSVPVFITQTSSETTRFTPLKPEA